MVELIQESLAHCGIEVKLSRVWSLRNGSSGWTTGNLKQPWARGRLATFNGDPTQLWNPATRPTVKHSSNYHRLQ